MGDQAQGAAGTAGSLDVAEGSAPKTGTVRETPRAEPGRTEMNTSQPAGRNPFRAIRGLLLGYLGIGIAALVAVILLRNHPAEVNSAAWVRSIVVVGTALILLSGGHPARTGEPGRVPAPAHP